MNWGTVSGVMAALLIAVFLLLIGWAFSKRQSRRFEEAAQLALDPEDRSISIDDMERRT